MTAAVRQLDMLRGDVDAGDPHVDPQIDALLPVELGRARRRDGGGAATGEIAFREIRPVVRLRGIGAQHRDAACVALLAQHFGGGTAGAPTADDDDGVRRRGRGRCDSVGGCQAFAHIGDAITLSATFESATPLARSGPLRSVFVSLI